VQDHPRCFEDVFIGMSHFAGLFDSALGPANQVLRLALDPEVSRIVCQVGENGDEGPARKSLIEAFPERTVEMGNHRDHHVRRRVEPEAFEHANRRAVVQAHDPLQDPHELRAA